MFPRFKMPFCNLFTSVRRLALDRVTVLFFVYDNQMKKKEGLKYISFVYSREQTWMVAEFYSLSFYLPEELLCKLTYRF